MGCYNQPDPLMPIGVNPPPYPGPLGNPCCPYKPMVPPVPPMPPKCALPCDVTVFHRIMIPATMGDHTTVPPDTLEYRNVILEYEADSYVYIYSSDGVPTLISNGTGTNFNDLTNRPMYNGEVMTGLTNIPEVPTKISDMADAARIVCLEHTTANLTQGYNTLNNAIVDINKLDDEQGDQIRAAQNDIESLGCSKQDKLVSGQNIKTVNGYSLLGEGNVEITLESAGVQPLLVSGENIKTINGESLLGAGDIEITTGDDTRLTDTGATRANNLDNRMVTGWRSVSADPTSVTVSLATVNLDNGTASNTPETISAATTTQAGVMTADDKTKLTNLPNPIVTAVGISQAPDDEATSILTQVKDINSGESRTFTDDIPIVDSNHNGLMSVVDKDLLNTISSKTVQLDTAIADDKTSTVTIVKTTGEVGSDVVVNTELPLPVASADQSGVMNPEMYAQLQDNTLKIQTIIGNSTAIPALPENPTDEQISDAYKQATGQTEVPNGAKVTDPTGKTYVYNATTQKWELFSDGGTVEISPFTNDSYGSIIGNDVDGGVVSDGGKGLVKGWDKHTTDIANNASAIEAANTNITDLTTRVTANEAATTEAKSVADAATASIAQTNTTLEQTNAGLQEVQTKVQELETPVIPSQTVEGQAGLAGVDTSSFTGGEVVEVKNDENNSGKDSVYVWNATDSQWELKGNASPYALASEVDALAAKVAANTALIGDVDALLQKLDTGAGV